MELSQLNIRRTVFNLPLNNIDVPVLNGDELSLLDQLGMLSIKLLVDLSEDSGLLSLIEVNLLLLHPL